MEYDSRYSELTLGIFVVHMSFRELQAIYLQYSCFENTMIFESFLMLIIGEVAARFKAHAWRACILLSIVGSNPTLSARFIFIDEKRVFFYEI